MGRRARDLAITSLAPTAWGGVFIVSSQLLPPGVPLFDAVVRSLPAGAALVLLSRELPPPGWWPKLVVLAMLNFGLLYAGLFIAAQRLQGGPAAALINSQPFWVVLLGWPLLGVRPGPAPLLAALAGVAGVALIVVSPGAARSDLVGAAAGLGGGIAWSLGTVLVKRWGRPGGVVAYTGWQQLLAGLVLLPFAVLAEPLPHRLGWAAIAGYAYIAIAATAIAFALWFRGLERLDAGSVALLALLSPVIAFLLDVALLHRAPGWAQATGVALVLVAVYAGQRAQSRA